MKLPYRRFVASISIMAAISLGVPADGVSESKAVADDESPGGVPIEEVAPGVPDPAKESCVFNAPCSSFYVQCLFNYNLALSGREQYLYERIRLIEFQLKELWDKSVGLTPEQRNKELLKVVDLEMERARLVSEAQELAKQRGKSPAACHNVWTACCKSA